jgi:hypothetical protein
MFEYFLLAATTLTPVLAQGMNATDFTCPFNRGTPSIADVSSPGASVNSTGSVGFSFRDRDPWYLSVLGMIHLTSSRSAQLRLASQSTTQLQGAIGSLVKAFSASQTRHRMPASVYTNSRLLTLHPPATDAQESLAPSAWAICGSVYTMKKIQLLPRADVRGSGLAVETSKKV